MRTAGRIFFFLCLVVAASVFSVLVFFHGWRTERLETLVANATLVDTPAGSVEVFDSEKNKPCLVVLHGGAGGYDQGLAISDFLSSDFRILSLSRPGYLRTPLSSGMLPEQQADLLASLLQKKGIGQAAILAMGEGAAPALYALVRHPDLFSKIVLLSPVAFRTPDKIPAETALENFSGDMALWFCNLSLSLSPSSCLPAILETETSSPPYECFKRSASICSEPAQMEWLKKFFLSISPLSPREIGCRNDIVQTRAIFDIPLSSVRIPALIVRGESDSITSPDNTKKLLQNLPQAREFVAEGAGYILPGIGSSPSLTKEKILEFLLPEH